MPLYDIWDLFDKVGAVEFVCNGLYYSYEAEIRTSRTDFVRLYGHSETGSVKLGLFIREGNVLRCRGRISARSLENVPENLRYSLQNEPILFPKGSLSNPNVLLWNANGRRFVSIRHENHLPDEIMPYFCFLTPMEIDGTSCLGFEIDNDEKPLFSELIKE